MALFPSSANVCNYMFIRSNAVIIEKLISVTPGV